MDSKLVKAIMALLYRSETIGRSRPTLFIGGANKAGGDCAARPERIRSAIERLFSGDASDAG